MNKPKELPCVFLKDMPVITTKAIRDITAADDALDDYIFADIVKYFQLLSFDAAAEVKTYYFKKGTSQTGNIQARYEIENAPRSLQSGLIIDAEFDLNEDAHNPTKNRILVCTASEHDDIIKILETPGTDTDLYIRHGYIIDQDAIRLHDEKLKYYYYFETPDAIIGDHYFTIEELAQFTGSDEITEKDIIKLAKDYEAALSRYICTADDAYILDRVLYDPEDAAS